MSAETETGELDYEMSFKQLAAGAIGGTLGALLFGLLIELGVSDLTVAIAIPSVYGIEGPLPVGAWGLHLFNGGILGMLYVIVAHYEPFSRYSRSYRGAAALGVAFGIVLTALVALLLPVWARVGGGGLAELPAITPGVVIATVAGHVLFGLVVSLTYAMTAS